MLDQNLRTYKEQILLPAAEQIGTVLHPTTITLIGFGVGIGAGFATWAGNIPLALTLWALNRVLDGLDGTVARLSNRQSDLGGYIDILVDMAIYALLVVMLALNINTTSGYLALAFLLSTYYINAASWMYLSALLEKRALGTKSSGELTTITMPSGIVEGTETIIAYTLFLLFPAWIVPLYLIFGGLILLTVGQRIVWAVRNLQPIE